MSPTEDICASGPGGAYAVQQRSPGKVVSRAPPLVSVPAEAKDRRRSAFNKIGHKPSSELCDQTREPLSEPDVEVDTVGGQGTPRTADTELAHGNRIVLADAFPPLDFTFLRPHPAAVPKPVFASSQPMVPDTSAGTYGPLSRAGSQRSVEAQHPAAAPSAAVPAAAAPAAPAAPAAAPKKEQPVRAPVKIYPKYIVGEPAEIGHCPLPLKKRPLWPDTSTQQHFDPKRPVFQHVPGILFYDVPRITKLLMNM